MKPADWRSQMYVRYVRSANHPMKLRAERTLRRALRLQTVVAPSSAGVWYELVDGDWIQSEILRNGEYEVRSLALVRRLLRPGDTVVDVGGHVGQYALHAAQQVGDSGRVIVFEPNPRTHLVLARNVQLNEFRSVTPVLAAVGESAGPICMSSGAEGNWGTARQVRDQMAGSFWPVTIPLGVALPALGVTRIDVLKIDVEGFEPSVVASLDLKSALRPRHILFEYLPDLLRTQGFDPRGFLANLKDAGYELFDVGGASFDGGREPDEFNVWARDALRHD